MQMLSKCKFLDNVTFEENWNFMINMIFLYFLLPVRRLGSQKVYERRVPTRTFSPKLLSQA